MATTSTLENPEKDPRTEARKYQLRLCQEAVETNTIVYLGTGGGKTRIAVLLMYELRHLFQKPQKNVCVFLAPTVHLVQQQAMVIEHSTNFKVGSYFGNCKHLKNHHEWEKEMEQYEVLVMTPRMLQHSLHHCFIKMELVALLIFDECHHAQTQKRHPYAQIMKEFYRSSIKRPRIFGMTASPIMGKGGSNQVNYAKCINSLENLLDAKVCYVDDKELESFVASPDGKVYYYRPVVNNTSSSNLTYSKKLEAIKKQYISMVRGKVDDLKILQKKRKQLLRMHENLTFCLENLGLLGAIQAARILLSGDQSELNEMETEGNSDDNSLADLYLTNAATTFDSDVMKDSIGSDSVQLEALEEPFFSNKLLVLIEILSSHRLQADMKCIVFVKRIIVARSLAKILGNLKCLGFWKCEFLVGFHSGLKNMSRKMMNGIVEKFRSGKVNLLVATNVAEEGLDIQTCCLVIRFDLPETVASFIQSRGRARMQQSEYVFLVERDNEHEKKLIDDFICAENHMKKEIACRTSNETFDDLEETIYKVYSTGASISTGCSVSLFHHYCSKLLRDEYFSPMPEFYYIDDIGGIVCRIILPSNAPLRQVDSLPYSSKEDARRNACLKACMELHVRGALSDYLLPGQDDNEQEGSVVQPSETDGCGDENQELHEMLIPAALTVPWTGSENPIFLNFYFIQFIPVPEDRVYRKFGLFVKDPLPKEAETMEVDLHLAHGRIVKTGLIPSGIIEFDKFEIRHAEMFQEMFLKVILDRSEFVSDFVPLGKNDASQVSSSTFYLLLPVRPYKEDKMTVDWETVRGCLSSPVFRDPTDATDNGLSPMLTLELFNGAVNINDIRNSLVLTPHNNILFFIDDIIPGINGKSPFNNTNVPSYADYYRKKFGINLLHPEQPLLKAKQLFSLHNLLHNRLQENTEARELEEHFVELPPELCSLKILGFTRDIGSSLSLLPSLMHRLENLLVAIELKDMLSDSFPEGSEVTANIVLEAITTEKCLERFSLERLEVLGDAFLKYAVSRHLFLTYDALDEGQLTRKRSSIVNNSHLYELSIRNNLQVYIRDEWFDPCHFIALGRSRTVICSKDTETTIHFRKKSENTTDGADASDVKCNKHHHWLHRKTIADVVEALVGAFIVDSGFKAAIAFLRWIGIQVNFEVSDVSKAYVAAKSNLSLSSNIDIASHVASLEGLLDYHFVHKGLLLQAFVHPSYNKHSGGCYQRLEFLGDAVLDYLITSYLYSTYPDLKPGQLTDLRSMTVNNNSFAQIAVCQSFNKYLISDSDSLSEAIEKFANFVWRSDSENDLLDEPKCPKVLGDLIESCVGAVLLDTGFDLNHVWRLMLNFLDPILSFSSLQLSPIRELQELCQSCNFQLKFSDPEKCRGGTFLVKAEVNVNGVCSTTSASNQNGRVARRMAAQKALSELKALGYKHKSKPLEEVLRSSRTGEASLIGYDELPTRMEDVDTIQLEQLHLRGSKEDSSSSNTCTTSGEAFSKMPSPSKSVERQNSDSREANNFTGTSYKGSARSRLYEICASNYWKPPTFKCCKDEGPSHLRMFTFKVLVEIEEVETTVLECFGVPRANKKAAEEHAAEGALWYLQHYGYLSKEE